MEEKKELALTQREIEVLKHLVNGKNNTQIAKEMSVSVSTVKAHVSSIFKKMGVNDRVLVAVNAIRKGVVD